MIKIRIEYVLNNNKAETYRGSDSFSETNNVINDLWYSDSATLLKYEASSQLDCIEPGTNDVWIFRGALFIFEVRQGDAISKCPL